MAQETVPNIALGPEFYSRIPHAVDPGGTVIVIPSDVVTTTVPLVGFGGDTPPLLKISYPIGG